MIVIEFANTFKASLNIQYGNSLETNNDELGAVDHKCSE